MAMVMDLQQKQQPQGVYKYYCRICKKGFVCRRALGGHMRAHGVETTDPHGKWDGKLCPAAGSKRMYALRTNPNRLKSSRVCDNCGKEFVSWKSFVEHGLCSSDDEGCGSMAPSEEGDGALRTMGCAGWSKGKRSRLVNVAAAVGGTLLHCPSSEEEDLANCLMMLSAARVDPAIALAEPEESCASDSREEDLLMLPMADSASRFAAVENKFDVPRGMFECKACKKVFSSHQALGGHRASHKKVKGCFAAKLDDLEEAIPPGDEVISHGNNPTNNSSCTTNGALGVKPLKRKSKLYECSICHRVFASGQALGGHKRCHRITSNTPAKLPQLQLESMFDCLEPPVDLNLPAPTDILSAPLWFDAPSSIYMHTRAEDHNNKNGSNKNDGTISTNSNYNEASNPTVDDAFDSRLRLARLSELKDINIRGESSCWLQVGFNFGQSNTNT